MATTLEEYWAGLGNRVLEPYPTVSGGTPENTPRQAVARLYQAGIPIDQIAQMTGVAPDIVAMDVAVLSGNRGAFMPEPPPVTEDIQGIGIESLYTNTDTPELTEFVDRGNTITDLVNDQVLGGIQTPKPFDYLNEIQILETLTDMGVDIDEEDADALDEEDDLTKKIIYSSAAGASSNGVDDEDAVKTIETMVGISSAFDLNNPDDVKAQLEVYKNAAKLFFDTEDLEKLIPQPDKTLPFMVAGAALIQAGSKGDSWGEALSNAFMQYAGTKRKGETEYEKQILGLRLNEQKQVQQLAASLYLEDRKSQKALANSMLNADVQLYKIEGSEMPFPMTDAELRASRNIDGFNVLGKWTEADGVLKNYTITDGSGNRIVRALTQGAATELIDSGLWSNVEVGDKLAGMKMYNIDGVNKMMLPEEAKQLQEGGAKISVARAKDRVAAYDTQKGYNVWVDNAVLEREIAAGVNRYVPIDNNISFAIGDDGNPILGNAAMITGILGTKATGKVITDFETKYTTGNFTRNRILTTVDEIRSVVSSAQAEGNDVFFGTAGELGKAGRRIINEVNQLGKIFSGKDSDWNFYKSTSPDGDFNPQTDQKQTYNQFKNSFGLGDYVDNSGFGQFLVKSGLKKKEAENLIFQLALTSAMLEGQKGRDISDKDIERFLNRAGANATSQTELMTLLDNLEFNAIDYVDKLADSNLRLSPHKMRNPDGSGSVSVLQYHFGDIIEKDNDYIPTEGTENIGQRRERLKDRRVQDNLTESPIGTFVGPNPALSGGDQRSGYGSQTIHDLYVTFISEGGFEDMEKSGRFITKVRNLLKADSDEYKRFANYIKAQRAVE